MNTNIIHLVEDILYRHSPSMEDLLKKADAEPNGIPDRQISLIVEAFERKPYTDYFQSLIDTQSFTRAPFRSSITRAFIRTCFRNNNQMFKILLDALSRRDYEPRQLAFALGWPKRMFNGFSLANVGLMEEWIKRVNCPLPIIWDKNDATPEMANPLLAARFANVIKQVLERDPIRIGTDYLRFLTYFMEQIPVAWWNFLYASLDDGLRIILEKEAQKGLFSRWRVQQMINSMSTRVA